MPRRKSKYQPDRKIRILREYRGADREFAWEVVATAYAMRRDMRGSAMDDDGSERYVKSVTYVVPKTVRYSAPAEASGSDAFGAREFGEAPIGGRGQQAGQRFMARGAQAAPGDAVQDMGVHGYPIFPIQDVHEMLDRKRVELVCKREDRTGRIYGD